MSDTRAAAITRDLIKAVEEVVKKHGVTHPEYRAAIDFVTEAVAEGETSLLFDAFLEAKVVAASAETQKGTHRQVLGPFYLPEPAWLENGQLAGPDETGEKLTVVGNVRSVTGEQLAGAELDFWQADADGRYSNFSPGVADGNLRGRLRSGEDGTYMMRTVVPAPYTIPHHGPTGRLLEELGRHPWRPAHLHLTVHADGYESLTTQIYFEGDKYLESDAVNAARSELVFPLKDGGGGSVLEFDIELDKL
jgi:catechol 1,2-dioxygenase